MENFRKFRLIKEKILPLALAGSLTLSLSSCNGEIDLSNITATEIVSHSTIKDITLIDELIESEKIKSVDDLNIIEAADYLERCIAICELLEEEKLESVDELVPITEEEKEAVMNLSIDEIKELITIANKKVKTLKEMEDKVSANKKINYLYETSKTWINARGKDVSIDFMLTAIKACVADELDISPDDYYKITVPAIRGTSDDGPGDRYIKVDGTSYKIPRSSSELIDTIDYIYSVQMYIPKESSKYATYKKAINYGKTTIAAGANLEDDKLVAQYSKKYILGNFFSK